MKKVLTALFVAAILMVTTAVSVFADLLPEQQTGSVSVGVIILIVAIVVVAVFLLIFFLKRKKKP